MRAHLEARVLEIIQRERVFAGHNQCSVVKKVVESAELFALFEAVVGSICSTSEFKSFVTLNMAEYMLNEVVMMKKSSDVHMYLQCLPLSF